MAKARASHPGEPRVPAQSAGPRRGEPIGIVLARLGKDLDRAFDRALAASGGSRPTWLILLAVTTGEVGSQAQLAERVGISAPTLTHHLDRLEGAGLIARTRDPADRRPYAITLTAAGDTLFDRLRGAAIAFDERLRTGIGDSDLEKVRRLARTMTANLAEPLP